MLSVIETYDNLSVSEACKNCWLFALIVSNMIGDQRACKIAPFLGLIFIYYGRACSSCLYPVSYVKRSERSQVNDSENVCCFRPDAWTLLAV